MAGTRVKVQASEFTTESIIASAGNQGQGANSADLVARAGSSRLRGAVPNCGTTSRGDSRLPELQRVRAGACPNHSVRAAICPNRSLSEPRPLGSGDDLSA